MLAETSPSASAAGDRVASWSAVFALSLGAFALVAAEFMPVSLLTPIATDLAISDGAAGQAITMSGAFAVLTSLCISSLAARVDRKTLLLSLTGLTIVSGTVVALSPSYAIFMIGRALIGIAIGGFWSMSAATAVRLVPTDQVPRALAAVNGGNALATVVSAPLGSFLGGLIGWRAAAFCVVPVAAIVLFWQLVSLPTLKPAKRPGADHAIHLLGQPLVALGMGAVSLFFMGQFTLFTYLRPFLETVTRAGVPDLSAMLLLMGVAGLLGTALIGRLLRAGLYRTLATIPALMAGIALTLVMVVAWMPAVVTLLVAWGLLATSAPVGWWTWLARTLPHDSEAGGGLMVAIIQLAITTDAGLGGVLLDAVGYKFVFGASTVLLLLSALVTLAASNARARS